MGARTPAMESFAEAQEALGLDGEPTLEVTRVPQNDDEQLGPSLFRTRAEKVTLSRLTLPGLYVGRCELIEIALIDCDLRLSNLCWNDFRSCSFDSSSLADSDLRASTFDRCSFRGTDLSRADLRRSTFTDCAFDGANLRGAIANDDFKAMIRLSAAQIASIGWKSDEGDEPPGG
jgi:uncharacterized protein YjbI with pentapeptide repeats